MQRVLARLGALKAPNKVIPGEALSDDPMLKHLWQEYQDTIHEQKAIDPKTGVLEVVAYRSTLPAETFFNTQALVDSRLRTEFVKHLPGIFTGLGIIGTFLGLLKGLEAFHIDDNPQVVRQSLEALLSGVYEAFLVSATAISLAMFITIVEKWVISGLYKKVEELTFILDGMFESGAGEEYLARLVTASESSASQTKMLKDALVTDLKQVLSELTERQISANAAGHQQLGDQIVKSLQTGLEEPLRQISGAVAQMGGSQSDAMGRVLTDSIAALTQRMQELFGDQITGINELQQQTIQALQTAVAKLEQMATSVDSAGQRATDAMSSKLIDALGAMEARQQVMNTQMGEFVGQIRNSISQAQTESSQKLQETLAQLGGSVSQIVDTLQLQVEQAGRAHVEREQRLSNNTVQAVSALGSQVESAMTKVSEVSAQALQTAGTKLEQMATNVDTAGQRATDAMSSRLIAAISAMETRQQVMNTQMGEFVGQIRNLVSQSQTETSQKLQETLTQLGGSVTQMVETLNAQAEQAGHAHVEREKRITDNTTQAVSSLGGQVETVLAKVSEVSVEIGNSVKAMQTITTDAITLMNSGAETLFVASSDFAKAGQAVAGVLTQATSLSDKLLQSAGAINMSANSLEGVVSDYRATRETLAVMLTELGRLVESAKREAALTEDVLSRIEGATAKLSEAQVQADSYLEGISSVLGEAHEVFANNMEKTLGQANREFYNQISNATKLLRDAILELEATLSGISPKK